MRLGICFSPAGLLFPYYVGAGYELQRLGILQPQTPLGGSSAGAIVAACLACGVPEETVRLGLARLVDDVRAGTRLNVALRKQLETFMNDDSPVLAAKHGLTLGYFEVLPRPGPRLVRAWADRDDLIDCICASSNWPLFFSRWPFVRCRGAWCLDGFFSVPRSRFGCPVLSEGVTRTLAVTALPKVSLSAFPDEDIIQPGRAGYAPALPVDDSKWFNWALTPAADEQLDAMVELGRQHARVWASRERDSLSPATLI